MENQQWNQGPEQEPFTAQQPQQQAYGGAGWQQPQQPYGNAGYGQQPPAYPVPQPQKLQSRLSGGWKVLYAVLGIFAPIVALLVAFLKSRNSQSGDAEIRESVKYMLIGAIIGIVAAIVLVLIGMSVLTWLAVGLASI